MVGVTVVMRADRVVVHLLCNGPQIDRQRLPGAIPDFDTVTRQQKHARRY